MENITVELVRQCLGNKFESFYYLPARGTRGGILLAWDATVVQLLNPHTTTNTLTAVVKPVDGPEWWITGVYGPQGDREKIEFLQEIVEVRELLAGPCVLVGDFNLLVNLEDKNNAPINRKNMILTLKHEDQIITGQEEIAEVVDDFYDNLFGHAPARAHSLDLDKLDVSSKDLEHLERPFLPQEVERVVKAMQLDKAPGPDGFTGRFYATCWHIIKDDFMHALDMFHRTDMRGLGAINKAIVTLLPKRPGATELKEFRLVSLIHGAIKIFDKVLADRLAEELPTIVGVHQSAFVKMDITKAFDSVQWPFLIETLSKLGFGGRWVNHQDHSDDIATVQSTMRCQIGSFPCKYLGLLLTLREQRASQLHDLVDQMAARLPTWRATSLPKSGCLLLVQSVLCAIPIHAMMALDIPPKTLLAMSKLCRGFLWCGKDKANGGNCAVAWDTVCTPKWAGGLELPNLGWLNCAMQARWPWLQHTDPLRPWSEFQINVPKESMDLFRAAANTTIGNGCTALFWEDRWLQGYRV
ncbi:uncharacterized protein [Aegilops tauschii subsp. strangulata]|uniref:uncharacterized protein n=1 Tax=Aegilops tauschii subsp. strangulata TaxID=200361 RepID=UPI003CC8743E